MVALFIENSFSAENNVPQLSQQTRLQFPPTSAFMRCLSKKIFEPKWRKKDRERGRQKERERERERERRNS